MAALLLAWSAGALADAAGVARLDVADQASPTFTVFTSTDGLSDEIWSTIGQDRRGFIWAGSASALARFDGYHWTPEAFDSARSLVRDMLTDADGMLWAIFESEGLARHDGHEWALRDQVDGFLHRFSDTTRADGTREFWIAQDRGFSRLIQGHWQEDPGNASVTSGRAIALARTETLFGGPRQWMASAQDGLWFREAPANGPPGPWQRFDAPELNRMLSTDLLRSVDQGIEELWILSYGGGLARIRPDGIRIWRASSGELPSEALYSALATYSPQGHRTAWVASRAGLLQIRGDTITVFDRRHGLPSDAVRGIKLQRSIDGVDLLWLATEGGIARATLSESQWQTVSLLGARENGIFSVMIEPDGQGGERLWVGTTKRGVGLLQDGKWRNFTLAEGTLPTEGVRGIWRVPGPDGSPLRLLALVGGSMLRVDDALGFTPFEVPWPQQDEVAAGAVLARQHDGSHELWFGTFHDGVYRLRNDRWTRFELEPASSSVWSVFSFAEQLDASGRSWLWAATGLGLARFDGEQWQRLPDALELPSDIYRHLNLIEMAGRSVLWASSSRHGVVRLDVTDPSAPTLMPAGDLPPPPDPTVYSVLRDQAGRIYTCTNNGVQQLTPRDDGGWDERVFRRRDGLVHDECNTGAQLIDAHDRYWAGTLGGLSVYDPSIRSTAVDSKPKPLFITEVRADGTQLPIPDEETLPIAAGTRELRIDYTLLSGMYESASTYRSQLLPFDPEPSAWGVERSRSFTRLSPGPYELRLEARDYAGTPAQARTFKFSVAPFWWQRAWVLPSSILLLLLAATGGVGLYNRNLRSRQRQLTREVALRTTELNTANLRLTELSYLDPLTGVANRRRLMEAIDDAIERAREKSLPLGLIVIDVDHFKHYNDRHGHLAGDAALRAIANALKSATREQDLVARFGGEEFACLLVDAGIETVARIAERMRALVEALPPRALGNDVDTITMSAGVLSCVPAPGQQAAELLRDTDVALYRAKHEGRNRVRQARP